MTTLENHTNLYLDKVLDGHWYRERWIKTIKKDSLTSQPKVKKLIRNVVSQSIYRETTKP